MGTFLKHSVYRVLENFFEPLTKDIHPLCPSDYDMISEQCAYDSGVIVCLYTPC